MQDANPHLVPPHNKVPPLPEDDDIQKVEEEEDEKEEHKENVSRQSSSALSPTQLQEIRIFEPGYSQWKGTNRLFCKGRVIGGPEIWKLATTSSIIVLPSALYLSWTFS